MTTFEELTQAIKSAKCPEDIFSVEFPDRDFKRFKVLLHPDKNLDRADEAAEAFKELARWWDIAEEKVKKDTWGDRKCHVMAVLSTKSRVYTLSALRGHDSVCDLYDATDDRGNAVIVKIPRAPIDSEFVIAEVNNLTTIHEKSLRPSPLLERYLPRPLDSFRTRRGSEKVTVSVMAAPPTDDWYSLRQVIKTRPEGIDLADAAWMFNRMLEAISIAHDMGFVHGGLSPSSFYIHPPTHYGFLSGWYYSTKIGGTVKGFDPAEVWCLAPEVSHKIPVGPHTDIYGAAYSFISLVEPKTGRLDPTKIRSGIIGLVQSCLLSPTTRQNDSVEVREKFRKMLLEIYGPPTFRPFSL